MTGRKITHLAKTYTVEMARIEFVGILKSLRPCFGGQRESFYEMAKAIDEAMPDGMPAWLPNILAGCSPECLAREIVEAIDGDRKTEKRFLLFAYDEFEKMQEKATGKAIDEIDMTELTLKGSLLCGWMWKSGESEKEFKENIENSFRYYLKNYIRQEKEQMEKAGAIPFKIEHFAWLVRRTVKPIETQENIAGSTVDASEVRRETHRLAKFIGLHLRKRGSSRARGKNASRKNLP